MVIKLTQDDINDLFVVLITKKMNRSIQMFLYAIFYMIYIYDI